MNELMTTPKNNLALFQAMDTDELKKRLAETINVTARGLYETSLIYEELRARGEPVEEMRLALAPYLPRIARGEIAAEAVLSLAGQKTALDRVSLMPPDRQRAILGESFPVVTDVGGAAPVVVSRRIVEMSAREVKLLITDDGRVLSADAQAEVLRHEKPKTPPRGVVRPRGTQPRISVSGGYVIVGKQAVQQNYLVDQLRTLGVLK